VYAKHAGLKPRRYEKQTQVERDGESIGPKTQRYTSRNGWGAAMLRPYV